MIGYRSDGFGYEIFTERTGLTCNVEIFQGRYDLWPFCKPYDAEHWWLIEDEDTADAAASQLTHYLSQFPIRIAPPRISFRNENGDLRLTNNGHICGPALYRGEDAKSTWPFHKDPGWMRPADELTALRYVLKLQAYLDARAKR